MKDNQTVTKPICSICIANYNGRDVIGPCLESVYAQDMDIPTEVIVHDDASTDNSVDFVREHFPHVTLIQSHTNLGYCASNNIMVSRAQGEFILLLNNDTTLRNDALKTLYTFATTLKNPAIVGLPQYNMRSRQLVDRGSLFDPFLNPVPNLSGRRHDVGMISGACMWMPKVLWNELEGFPDWFENIAEDTYISCRARLMGYSVMSIPESGVDHWIGKNIGGGKIEEGHLRTTYTRRYYSERNKMYTMTICYPSFVMYLFMPFHLIALSIEGLLLTMIKRDPRIWREIYGKALQAVWRNRCNLIRERRALQRNRRMGPRQFFSAFVYYPYKITMLLRYGLPSVTG